MNNDFYEKQFRAGDSSVSRSDLESLPCPFCTENVSDTIMQSIVEQTDLATRCNLNLNSDEHIDFSNHRHSEMWWSELERVVCSFQVPYYEDL